MNKNLIKLSCLALSCLVMSSQQSLAETKTCTGTCSGTGQADTLTGTAGINNINGFRGPDIIDGKCNADKLNGDRGDDTLYGGCLNDKTELTGGLGSDTFIITANKKKSTGDTPKFIMPEPRNIKSTTHSYSTLIKDFDKNTDTVKIQVAVSKHSECGDGRLGVAGASKGKLLHTVVSHDSAGNNDYLVTIQCANNYMIGSNVLNYKIYDAFWIRSKPGVSLEEGDVTVEYLTQ